MTALIQSAGIPKSTYYNLVKRMNRPDPDANLKEEITAIYEEHEGHYGYRRIRDELGNRGQKVNHKKVQRIMKDLGLNSLYVKKNKLDKRPVCILAPESIINTHFPHTPLNLSYTYLQSNRMELEINC